MVLIDCEISLIMSIVDYDTQGLDPQFLRRKHSRQVLLWLLICAKESAGKSEMCKEVVLNEQVV